MPAKILIADDHASVRRGIRALLEKDGEYTVCCEAQDGLEAVRMAKRCRHDLIIIDLLMPNLNGFHAAKEIRTSVPGVPIVLHTLYGGTAVEHEAKKFGVDVVVTKVGSRSLKKVIEQILRAEKADAPTTAA